MKITEKWIAKTAGWKANKAGRDLYKQGAVITSSVNGNIITGTLKSGAKPTRVTVKIHSPIDIDTVCPRLACRRTGEVCAHAVAIMLHTIADEINIAPPTATNSQTKNSSHSSETRPTHPITPLSIELPPNFPSSLRGGSGGLSIRLLPFSPEEPAALPAHPKEIDAKLSQWLTQLTGKATPTMLALRSSHALEFLHTIAAHSRIYLHHSKPNQQRIIISNKGTRIPMQLQRLDDRIAIQLTPAITKHGTAWHHSDHLYLWDDQQKCLLIHPTAKLWKPRHWQRLAEGKQIHLTILEFLQSLPQQNDLIIWDDADTDLETLISPGEPEFELTLAGDTTQLHATLQARYSPELTIPIGLGCETQNAAKFPIPAPQKPLHFLSQNTDAENNAAATLMQAGFLPAPQTLAGWSLSGEDNIIEFLTTTLPELNKTWHIHTASKLRSLTNNIVRIIPHFEILDTKKLPQQRSGQDWLAFDISFHSDQGKPIPREVIQRMLATGTRKGTSKNGKQVIISKFDADTVEALLLDTDPRQENGIYYAPKLQAAYLKRLRAHYTHTTPENPDLSVIQSLPANIQSTLRPYQKEGIAWLYQRATQEGSALLADDMGLGKTLQTLALIHLLKPTSSAPSLIVCPTSLLQNWQAETEKFFPALRTLILHGSKRKQQFVSAHDADILITSYALIARDLDFYKKLQISTLAIDEASLIRNPDTQAAKALRQLNANHRIALSGTPVENAVQDLWSLFAFLLPGYLGSRKDFQQRYQQPLTSTAPDPHTMQRLRLRIEPFMLRRTKANVAKDLPPKIEQVVLCPTTPEQRQTYIQLLHQGAQKVAASTAGAASIHTLTALLRLRQAASDLRLIDPETTLTPEQSSAKLTRLIELLTEAKAGGHRTLVFSQFTQMLALIKSALDSAAITYAYLDGSTRDRQSEVDKFQSPSGPDVFLISLKAGGYGLNLTAADTVIHYDPWWNPAVEAQATDRAHRIGQSKPITVYKLVTQGTVEEKILHLQKNKRNIINATIGDDNSPLMQGLSQKEIASLLTDH